MQVRWGLVCGVCRPAGQDEVKELVVSYCSGVVYPMELERNRVASNPISLPRVLMVFLLAQCAL